MATTETGSATTQSEVELQPSADLEISTIRKVAKLATANWEGANFRSVTPHIKTEVIDHEQQYSPTKPSN